MTLQSSRIVISQGFDNPLLVAQAWSLRHQVFRTDLGWDVSSRNSLEWDQFDRWAWHCFLIQGDCVIAYWRALPTVQPYLLEQSFQTLLGGREAPRRSDVWEISRFLVAPDHPDRGRIGRRMVLEAGMFGAQAGASTLIAVVEPPFARFIRGTGLPIRQECPPTTVGIGTRGEVKAVLISLDVAALNAGIAAIAAIAA